MNNVISDRSKFKKMSSSEDIFKVNLNMEDKINYQLRKLKANSSITDNEYNHMYVSGSSPPILYGLPKIHKEGIPVRPILAAYKAPSYKLATFLIGFLQYFTSNQYTLKNSYEFKEIITNSNFPPNVTLASFDITSLYTNVPIDETIDIAVSKVYDNDNQIRNISRSTFRKLLQLCISDNHFIFDKEHYSQFEGFAMESPLPAPMANIFLCHHEEQWIQDCPIDFKPLLYRRYVDDTFLDFRHLEQVDTFFSST